MQDFNQIEHVWLTQQKETPLQSADKMLEEVKNASAILNQKNKINLGVLILASLLLIAINCLMSFKWTTHVAISIITIALVSAIYQYYKIHQLIKKKDYLQKPADFIVQIKAFQIRKLYLYQGFYWCYTLCISLGLALCFFELQEIYTNSTVLCIGIGVFIWILLASLYIRKKAISKMKDETQVLLQHLEMQNYEID